MLIYLDEKIKPEAEAAVHPQHKFPVLIEIHCTATLTGELPGLEQ